MGAQLRCQRREPTEEVLTEKLAEWSREREEYADRATVKGLVPCPESVGIPEESAVRQAMPRSASGTSRRDLEEHLDPLWHGRV
jgi:hypothetical protein